MAATQQQLDDLLEQFIALTDVGEPGLRCARMARLVLVLAERVGDPEAVRQAVDEAMRSEGGELHPGIP